MITNCYYSTYNRTVVIDPKDNSSPAVTFTKQRLLFSSFSRQIQSDIIKVRQTRTTRLRIVRTAKANSQFANISQDNTLITIIR
jgi:hypothetical protein